MTVKMRNKQLKNTLILMCVIAFVISVVVFFINHICGALCFMLASLLITAFVIHENERYQQTQLLNDYLSRVCTGDYSLDISDNEEGEYSLLKNNIYKVVVMLRATNEALKNDRATLADFLANVSHQLKTPLTSMMVMNDIIREEQDEKKRDEFLNIVRNQLEKTKWLITTILKISKLDAGVVEFVKTDFPIDEAIDECLKPFMIAVDLKNINIIKKIENFTLHCDRNWTVEAIQNIIKNCLEHSRDGGELEITSRSTNIFYELVIADNGCGIAKKDLPHIFERFYHGENSSQDSVGIGLALSKEILSSQNAGIEVTSREGEGSRFIIKFYKSIV